MFKSTFVPIVQRIFIYIMTGNAVRNDVFFMMTENDTKDDAEM